MKFRKKPVEVEAVEIATILRIVNLGAVRTLLPFWVERALQDSRIIPTSGGLSVQTLEGTMRGKPTDWLIKGVKGELYPCDHEIFKETYDPVV